MNKMQLRRVALAVAGVAFAASSAFAQMGTSNSAPGNGTGVGGPGGVTAPRAASGTHAGDRVARADAGFLKQAAQNGHMEIEGSKLALEKATDPQVKQFAQQMIDDHTKMHGELTTLAGTKGVELPKEPSIAQRAALKLLSTADGGNFDRRYADVVGVKAHEDTLKMFQKAAREAKDPQVKALAEKSVPALDHHLKMARDLRDHTRATKKQAEAAKERNGK
jgi:putative membrane protein